MFGTTVATLGDTAVTTMIPVARNAGRELAARFTTGTGDRGGPHCLDALLGAVGYEAYDDGPATLLGNCLFGRLAQDLRQLVCTANLHLLRGVLEKLAPDMTAVLDPVPGGCCVRLQPAR